MGMDGCTSKHVPEEDTQSPWETGRNTCQHSPLAPEGDPGKESIVEQGWAKGLLLGWAGLVAPTWASLLSAYFTSACDHVISYGVVQIQAGWSVPQKRGHVARLQMPHLNWASPASQRECPSAAWADAAERSQWFLSAASDRTYTYTILWVGLQRAS